MPSATRPMRVTGLLVGLVVIGTFAGLPAVAEPPVPDSYKVPKRLGPPDARRFPDLKRLHPDADVWIDKENGRVLLRAGVCLRKGPIELFACNHKWIEDPVTGEPVRRGTKEYESIVTVGAPPAVIHAALLAVGARSGSPVRFRPNYQPAHGSPIEITLHWKDKAGKRHHTKAQQWIRNTQTEEALGHHWVFAGSRFVKHPQTGQERYLAAHGNVICVSNFTDAMLDLPIKSTQRNDALLFEAFTERIPPVGTAVTVVLQPRDEADSPGQEPSAPAPR